MPTAAQQSFTTAAGKKFCSKIWKGFGIDIAPATLSMRISDHMTDDRQNLDIGNPSDGAYKLQVFGTETGPFSLDFIGYDSLGRRACRDHTLRPSRRGCAGCHRHEARPTMMV
jgi:hypothetical protein